MGVLQSLRILAPANDLLRAEAVGLAPVGTHAVSEGALQQLDPAVAVAFGIGGDPALIDRRAAMRIPSVKRGRSLIAGTIGTLPLVCTRNAEPVRRPVLDDLDPRTTPAYTLTWTIDDLLFHGISWWRVLSRDDQDYPRTVERLAPGRVVIVQPDGRAQVDGEPANDGDLIRFDGPDEGLLAQGSGAGGILPLALALQRAATRNADDDVPTMLLKLAEGAPELTRPQIIELLNEWEASRAQRRHAYTNRSIVPEVVNFKASDRQLTELSELVSSELARFLNLPASRLGAPAGNGMTYTSTEADRRDLVDTTLGLYLTPIRQRLSLGDFTPAGQVVSWDLTGYLRGDTVELVNAGVAAIDAGLTDAPEVRTRWLGLPPRTDLPQPTPAPAPAPREDNGQ